VSMHSFATVLQDWLFKLSPARVIEWGPGHSTEILLKNGCDVLSIEHNPKWFEKASQQFGEALGWQGLLIDCTARNSEYAMIAVQEKDRQGGFDLAFVDGRRRVECVVAALQAVKPEGVIILHDWRRQNYQRLIRSLPHVSVLEERDNTVVLQLVSQPAPRPARKRASRKTPTTEAAE